MSGVYGSVLSAFPEQIEKIAVFAMSPKINGGFEKRGEVVHIKGLYQSTQAKNITDSNGNLAYTSSLELWTTTKGLIGRFLSLEGDVYRIAGEKKWTREGNFCVYELEKVVGNGGVNAREPAWNFGENSFG